MYKLHKLLSLTLLLAGCTATTTNNAGKPDQKKTAVRDTTPKVTGIGGVFFSSESPKKAREWYGKNLGLAMNDYGSAFEFRNANRPEEINYLQWSLHKKGSKYFLPSEREFMINYRVQNIEGLIRNLKKEGVTIVDTLETYNYGKFIHIMDPDGNKIELWEPVDSILTKMGGKTTK
jgi:predicted enzyme related to lactoylglutathione lyase